MRRIRLVAAISAGLALTAGGVPPAVAGTPRPTTVTTKPPAGGSTTVRLVTGDRVTVTTSADGRRIASVQPGHGRHGVLFRTVEQNGDLTVLPSDAVDLVNSGRLDRQLFDVSALIKQRYDEAHSDALPLIIGQSGGIPAAEVKKLSALTTNEAPARRLDSIDAQAVRVSADDLGRFWKQLASAGGTSGAARIAATPKVWLDARVDAALDRSTDQINAPALWKAGYDGKAVKVAVLDTGADQSHPDLAGRISQAKDFSGSSGTGDAFGHGTHVAATVGGSGAASGGSRKGVAPGVDLLIGKVLGDDGYGTESQVIDGMEWAASAGAKVVNMSLGADIATDGTDPMSLAVNDINARSGALFVVAAGNSGQQGPRTVGSPGAADAALTVGAVDRDDALAPFSSRGPRTGDRAVKPDVTAPGVGIVAARAAGTTMGEPVDQYYVAASGTSMATPHVTGAAALLAQAHPTWSAQRIKDALISTAHTVQGGQPTEQGGGRIDVAAAALGPVTATGTVALGPFSTGDDTGAPRTATVRYTNTSDKDVTLALTARLATTGGRDLAPGALRLDSDSVRIAPGATADVPVTADPARAGRGDYYGYLTAASADGTVKVHTTLSLVVHGPTHQLTVTTIDHNGKRVQALPTIWGADGFVDYTDGEKAVAEVEEGTYQLDYSSLDTAADGQELRQVVLPEVKVTKDTSVTLDARKTTRVDIRTPRPAEQRGILNYQTYRSIDGHGLLQGTMYFDLAKRLYVSPTKAVTDGSFEFASRWQLVAPLLRAKNSGTDLALAPYYMPNSPLFPAKGTTLTAVDAGTMEKPDFGRARGKLAVVRNETGADERDVARKAARAGVRGLLMVHFSDIAWTRWNPDEERDAVPTVRVSRSAGTALLARLKRHKTTVRFTGTARSPYLYDVMQTSRGQIPKHVVHTVSSHNSAVVKATYADNGGAPWAGEQSFAWRPYQDTAWLQYTRYVPTAFVRTEYVSADDTRWLHRVHHTTTFDIDTPLAVGMNDTPRTYRAGERLEERWQGAVVRPSIPAGFAAPSVRKGNVLALRVPEFTDSSAGHWSRLLAYEGGGVGGLDTKADGQRGDTAAAALYRDGVKVADADSAWTDFEVSPDPSDYRLDLTTSRADDEWAFGTRTDTSWSFHSAGTSGTTRLPLLQLDYDVPLDAHNTVHAARTHTIGLSVRAQDGLPAPRDVSLRVEVSYDDGRHWSSTRVKARGHNTFAATVTGPSGHGDRYVTLRATARDSAGHSVRQTVQRAYLLR
ncbi:S8 family serine peptidase [Streptomyces sp. S.PB5]|uniref:S8 family peptidase n=1 Tax=Streptomyces sp. S.PB5 TaxID=3020844 RepID=UPI0025B05701|nr:S8 family serine peptidase [Streptomyces sp. S.PB5]MDN3027544.1 S8 family serine peptidase [Streptomyces sp. S.PB5]